MADNDSHGTYDEVLEKTAKPLQSTVETLRKMILKLHKDAVEIAWPRQVIVSFGVGPKKMTEHYAYIAPHKAHVNLGFYHGAGLADPDGLLDGTGKKLRHIKIEKLTPANKKQFEKLLKAAIKDRKDSV